MLLQWIFLKTRNKNMRKACQQAHMPAVREQRRPTDSKSLFAQNKHVLPLRKHLKRWFF